MSQSEFRVSRIRAYVEFLGAVLYFFLARAMARHAANGLATEQFTPLVEQAMLVFLLLIGYAGFGLVLDRQQNPIRAQGWSVRKGWQGETSLGLAVGWAAAVLCVLPLAVAGGIAIRLSTNLFAWGWLLADFAFFALVAAGEEIAFRGYGFQRFSIAVGPIGAALGYAAFYAIVQALVPGSNHASVAVSVALSLALSTAYLRTKALWVSWGINFAWKASRALLFGLAISGVNSHSPIVQGDPMGPFWLTGGGFGLDGTWIAFAVLFAAMIVVYRLTRELDFRYNAPVIVPAGIPVDLDAAARRQHQAAMGPAEPTPPSLVQILPLPTPPPRPAKSRPAIPARSTLRSRNALNVPPASRPAVARTSPSALVRHQHHSPQPDNHGLPVKNLGNLAPPSPVSRLSTGTQSSSQAHRSERPPPPPSPCRPISREAEVSHDHHK
jgi:membrane protease YdiL (CAAX protease family)